MSTDGILLSEYMLGMAEMIAEYNATFKQSHPRFQGSDTAMLSEVMLGTDRLMCYFGRFESTQGQANKDISDNQRAIELCEKFLQSEKVEA